jgi:hypothetical protein
MQSGEKVGNRASVHATLATAILVARRNWSRDDGHCEKVVGLFDENSRQIRSEKPAASSSRRRLAVRRSIAPNFTLQYKHIFILIP